MDCCICSPMASAYRLPRNSICFSCFEGAKSMIAFLDEHGRDADEFSIPAASNGLKPSTKGMMSAFDRMKQMKEREDRMKEKIGFLGEIVVALREGIHTDIVVKPGSGPPIAAHRALLATKSEIFRTLLTSDECKAPAEEAITLPELSHDELKRLLEFLYGGSLRPHDDGGGGGAAGGESSRLYSLLLAADKYDIPFLKRCCEREILASLDTSNALDVLEVSDVCSNRELKDRAMNSVVDNVEDVVFSERFEGFAAKNAHLCVEITRAMLLRMKDKTDGSSQCDPVD